jgi:hypothetical protein
VTPPPAQQPVVVQAPPGTVVQPVYTQQLVQQPAGHHGAEHSPASAEHHEERHGGPLEVIIYSHSNFFYWWPVWVTGYVLALVTYLHGTQVHELGDTLFHPSKNLGVIYTLVFFLVIIITNVTMRGLSSVVLILAVAFTVLFLAYFHLWEDILAWLGHLYIFMNMGFYVFFSTLIFLVWAFSFFVYDRMTYWKVRPGQITHETVIGGAEKSYDTRGMVFEKHRKDLFRHWVLGLGSGDIQISTTGAKRETLCVPNVLFVNAKIGEIQRLIAMRPTEFAAPAT